MDTECLHYDLPVVSLISDGDEGMSVEVLYPPSVAPLEPEQRMWLTTINGQIITLLQISVLPHFKEKIMDMSTMVAMLKSSPKDITLVNIYFS